MHIFCSISMVSKDSINYINYVIYSPNLQDFASIEIFETALNTLLILFQYV